MIQDKVQANLLEFNNSHRVGINCFKYLKILSLLPSLLRKLKQQGVLGE